MATWTTPQTYTDDTLIDEDDLNEAIGASGDLAYLAENFPKRATLWHEDSTVTSGNGITVAVTADQYYNFRAYQDAAADGDTFTQSVTLAAGTYTMTILGSKGNTRGIIDWTLGGVSIETGQDWYDAAAATYNDVETVTSISVTNPGTYVLQGTVNGKNASSTDHYVVLTKISFKQSSD